MNDPKGGSRQEHLLRLDTRSGLIAQRVGPSSGASLCLALNEVWPVYWTGYSGSYPAQSSQYVYSESEPGSELSPMHHQRQDTVLGNLDRVRVVPRPDVLKRGARGENSFVVVTGTD